MAKKEQLKAVQAVRSRKKKKARKRKRVAVMILEIIILTFLIGAAYVMAKYDRFQTVTIDEGDIDINEGIKQEGYTTIALFGGDSRDGQLEEGTHADTMIIVSIDNESKEIKMASVYRDTFLQQEDGSYLKANNAYFCGGPKEAINMLNKNLDLDIEDYVTVDFKALVDTIDLVDGLDIDIKEEEVENINKYLQETADVAGTQTRAITQAGEQHLDGAQAVTYARIRSTAGGDYTRTERQRLVIQKMFEKGIKTNISTINDIIDTVFPQVSTSFSLTELIGLAAGATKYHLGENIGFPIDKTDDMRADVGSIVIAIDMADNVQKLHEFLYPKEEGYTVSSTVQKISDEISFLTGVVKMDDAGWQGDENYTGGDYTTGNDYGDYNGDSYNNYGNSGYDDYGNNGYNGYGDYGYGDYGDYDYNSGMQNYDGGYWDDTGSYTGEGIY